MNISSAKIEKTSDKINLLIGDRPAIEWKGNHIFYDPDTVAIELNEWRRNTVSAAVKDALENILITLLAFKEKKLTAEAAILVLQCFYTPEKITKDDIVYAIKKILPLMEDKDVSSN